VTTEQLSLDQALAARERGQTQVLEHSGDYRERLYTAIEQLAASGRIFNSDDVRELAGDPPAGQHPNITGAVFGAARKKGLIEYHGFTRSTRSVGHGNVVLRWSAPGRGGRP
jgi:hypothetical protein